MTKDMFIPSLFDVPRRAFPGGKTVTRTIKLKQLRQMIGALESVGLVVRLAEPGHYTCHASNQELLNAARGRNGTYLVRYAEGVTALMEKMK